ncbi:MAG: oxidoreductase [Bacteroidetes bacterium]|nr:MAG: oxidoreductase [Bacteroidota bacterium]
MELLQLTVIDIVRETKDAVSIFMKESNGSEISYQAGQFLTFIFNGPFGEIRRSYSFSSTPGIDKTVSITLKRVPNGEISRFFFEYLKAGDQLESLPASGRFTVDTNSSLKRHFCLVAAGSGITPIYSLMKKILHEERGSFITLIYQNRDEHSIIFEKELKRIEKEFPSRFKWIRLLSRPIERSHVSHRLNNELFERLVRNHVPMNDDTYFYICGPHSMMRMAEFTLKWMGIQDNQIRRENFSIDFIPPPPVLTDTTPKELTIHFQDHTHQISVAYPKNILQAALDNGIHLPYSCRGGRCSTCVAKLMKGKLKMSVNDVLTEKDLDEGLVLTCVGYALTDLELSF